MEVLYCSGLIVHLTSDLKDLVLAMVLFSQTRNFTPPCLSPPRCINGYSRLNAGVAQKINILADKQHQLQKALRTCATVYKNEILKHFIILTEK